MNPMLVTITITVVLVWKLVPASYPEYVPTKIKNIPKTRYVFW
jgi:hypothetical protein